MTELLKCLNDIVTNARVVWTEPRTSRNWQMAMDLIAEAESTDREVLDIVGLLIDHIEGLRAFVRDYPCECYAKPYDLCDRCKLLGEEQGDVR